MDFSRKHARTILRWLEEAKEHLEAVEPLLRDCRQALTNVLEKEGS